ncbi:MAG: PD-(D/E)XK motif protein [Balneola sp.]
MKNPWEAIKTPAKDVSALRINSEHPLELFWAKDHLGRYLLIYEYPSKSNIIIKDPPNLEGIETITSLSDNSTVRLILILNDKVDWELFYSLCYDLLRATLHSKSPETASAIILSRLRRWQNFLKKKRPNVLPEEKIKGLIGELLFIRNNLTPKYGCSDAIKFWRGPEGSPQDFSINQIAVEVKCQMGGSTPNIKISSADQLYTQLAELYLFVVTMGKSDDSNKDSINLNQLVNHIQILLDKESSSSISRFEDLLMEAGYVYNDKYEDYNYVISGFQVFQVLENFPRIISADLKPGIIKVSYSISLAECAPYEVELKNWTF